MPFENPYKRLTITLIILLTFAYTILSYYTTRDNTILLYGVLTILFGGYFFLIYYKNILRENVSLLISASFLFRLLFLFSVPALSDDYFRFVWDGDLLCQHINPYLYLPTDEALDQVASTSKGHTLLSNMNSPNYYSVYPPVLQAVFCAASYLSSSSILGSIVVFRIIILLAEIGTYCFLKKLLIHFSIPKEYILFYFLNPLIIIELTGNLHFEALMIFFTVASIYYLVKQKWLFAAIFLALAISTKLIPLLLMPLIVNKLGFKKGFAFCALTGLLFILTFVPFINTELVAHFSNSVELYFQKFEFNASLYYLFRWLGIHMSGYNQIAIIGKVFLLLASALILYLSFKKEKKENPLHFFYTASTILFFYYALALIVHPWYISFLVLLVVFTQKKYVLVWSALVFLSYNAYAQQPYKENGLALFIEYAVVFSLFFYELRADFIADRNKIKP